ncbi:MAG: tyrosine--tRNA ligase, partial [Candidatus Thorarchaeota archaeon]
MNGGHFITLPSDAVETVKNGKNLRIKFGIDPTRERLHLGHFVPLRLLKQLQEQGHSIHLILGTFTAQMGDPSGKDKTRPILDEATVKANGEKILEQVERVLHPGFTVHRNHMFFENMNVPFFLTQLTSQFTVAHMMARDGFKKRGQSGVAMHELLTPILQGWDSVMVNADVEIGGTDQLFNFQISRDLQAKQGQTPQVCLMTPIINGTDGRKMSKSLDNCIFLDDAPEEIFGKVMSISDEVMEEWIPLLADTDLSSIEHPMKKKKMLAANIVRQLHG